jgi:hypothetical protein
MKLAWASPGFLLRVAASVNCMWFSLRRTTYVVVGESGEVGNPGALVENEDDKGGLVRKGRAVTKESYNPGLAGRGRAHRRSLGSPGFPVKSCGFGQLHVVLFKENHIRGPW